jgi:hypothetical protein
VKPYYEQDGIAIFHGKAEEVLPFVPSVDLLCTDPPYGINVISATYQNKKTRPGAALAHKRNYCNSETWDSQPPPAWLIEQAIGKARHAIIFGGNYFELAPSSCWLVWDKENGANDFADCELIWTNLEKAVRRLKYTWNGMIQEHMGDAKEPRFHPTQKPLAVMTWAIQQAPDDCRLILDPFMGSGTTLRAAKDLGRHAIGIEQNERYCEIAAKRLAQGVLFGAGGAARATTPPSPTSAASTSATCAGRASSPRRPGSRRRCRERCGRSSPRPSSATQIDASTGRSGTAGTPRSTRRYRWRWATTSSGGVSRSRCCSSCWWRSRWTATTLRFR